jgi:Ca2+-dependent lipid-binding protein
MDEDMFEDDLVGSTILPLENIFRRGKFAGLLELTYKGRRAGEIMIEVEFFPEKIVTSQN